MATFDEQLDVTMEIRLTSPENGTLIENFVSNDESRIQDKITEWENDKMNYLYGITGYVWTAGVRMDAASKVIY